jgi:hypothetical protein
LHAQPDKTGKKLKAYIDRIKIYVYYQIKCHYPKLVLFEIKCNLCPSRKRNRSRKRRAEPSVHAVGEATGGLCYLAPTAMGQDGLILLFKALSIQLFNFR